MEVVTCSETEVYEKFAILKNEVTVLRTVDILLLGQWKCEGNNRLRNISRIHVLKFEAAWFIYTADPSCPFQDTITLIRFGYGWMDEWMNMYQIFCQVAVYGINGAESSSSDTTVLPLWPTPWTSCILYTGFCGSSWSINAMDILTSLSLIVQ